VTNEGDIETKDERLDAVDCLRLFVDTKCTIIIGMGASVKREDFQAKFEQYCQEHGVEPPSPQMLASILQKCYRTVFPGTVRDFRGAVPVWMNLHLKDEQRGGGA
jgi:hypothetical protein